MDVYIGLILPFAGNFTINGWAACNGQLLSISQYSALFSILGTAFGGNGTSNFALPDLRGRTAIGIGQSPGTSNYVIGQSSGTENATLLLNNLPTHTHMVATPVNTSPSTATSPANAYLGTDVVTIPHGATFTPTVTSYASSSTAGATAAPYPTQPSGNSQPFSILQPYLAINYQIALTGIFPSRA